MFRKLLDATRIACSGRDARSFLVGIGLADTEKIGAVISDCRAKLGETGLVLVAYHDRGGQDNLPVEGGVRWRPSSNPAMDMISDLKAGKVHAIIRGQLSSSTFLAELKRQFNLKHTYRLAMLSTAAREDFLFAPVGIDEGGDSEQKEILIELATELLQKIGIVPSFYLLSAGRLDDAERSPRIRDSIASTIRLVEKLKLQHPSLAIQHGEILIEDAFEKGANTIIAPDGISGNLIYRTLLHLGGGHSHGAFYLGPGFPGPVMDTSRVGTVEEYAGAIVLALRLLISRA
ncbi:MAG: hypothetical protein Q6373_002375 [Candidatus Sigynarchaeota archaeon]